jgi:hypothetical protein
MNWRLTVKNQYITWDEYYFRIDELISRFRSENDVEKYNFILSAEEDDDFIAAYVSHRLNIPMTNIYEYNTTYRGIFYTDNKRLVTSNICGPGSVYTSIVKKLRDDFDSLIIFKDKDSEFSPTYYHEIPELYIYFPWQKSEYLKEFESKC